MTSRRPFLAPHAGGRRLQTQRGSHTRPTSDRVREALFSTIEAWCGSLSGLRFLDLYAGSGAVGIEAWSRGAGVVTMVEQDRRASGLIRDNARAVGFRGAHVVTGSVATTLRRVPRAPYDLVFLDPPYPHGTDTVESDLHALRDHGLAGARRAGRRRALLAQHRSRLPRGLLRRPGAALRRDHALVRSRRLVP